MFVLSVLVILLALLQHASFVQPHPSIPIPLPVHHSSDSAASVTIPSGDPPKCRPDPLSSGPVAVAFPSSFSSPNNKVLRRIARTSLFGAQPRFTSIFTYVGDGPGLTAPTTRFPWPALSVRLAGRSGRTSSKGAKVGCSGKRGGIPWLLAVIPPHTPRRMARSRQREKTRPGAGGFDFWLVWGICSVPRANYFGSELF